MTVLGVAEVLVTANTSAFRRELRSAANEGGIGFTKVLPVAIAAAGVAVAKLGADFQTLTRKIVTEANESSKNLNLIRQGILQLSGQTGKSTTDLANGLYLIESAGFHGAQGLQVLKAAAEGARVGNAQLATVSDAVTTVLKNYGQGAGQAATVTSQLVAAVSVGKTRLEDLSGAMSVVLPNAATLGVKFADVAGTLATITERGGSARAAAQALNFTIKSLVVPTSTAAKQLAAMGLTSKQVTDTLRNRGLASAFELITDRAAQLYGRGTPQYIAAVARISGQSRGLQAILKTTGGSFDELVSNIHTVEGATTEAGNHVRGLAISQTDLNTQFDRFRYSVEAGAVSLGLKFAPALSKAFKTVNDGLQGSVGRNAGDFFASILGTPTSAEKHAKNVSASLRANTPHGARDREDAIAPVTPYQTFLSYIASFRVKVVAFGSQIASALVKTFRDISHAITADLLPALRHFGSFLSPLLPVLRVVTGVLGGGLLLAIRGIGETFRIVGPIILAVTGFLDKHKTAIYAVSTVIGVLAAFIAGPAVLSFVGLTIAINAVGVAYGIAEVATIAFSVAQRLLTAVMDANPFVLLVGAVIALGAGFIYAYKHSKTFRDIVQEALHAVGDAASSVGRFFVALGHDIGKIFNDAKIAASDLRVAFGRDFTRIKNDVSAVWNALFDIIKTVFRVAVDYVRNEVTFFKNILNDAFSLIKNLLTGNWSGMWESIKAIGRDAINFVIGIFKSFGIDLPQIVGGIVSGIENIWSRIKKAFQDPVKFVVKTVLDDGIIAGYNAVGGAIGLPHLNPLKYATGGAVPGQGSGDRVHALLEPGEFVVRKSVVNAVGLQALHALNGGHPAAKYSLGGVVGSIGSGISNATSAIGSGLSAAGGFVANIARDGIAGTIKLLTGPILKLVDAFSRSQHSPFASGLGNFAHTAVDDLVKFVTGGSGPASKGLPAGAVAASFIPIGQHKSLIDQALKIVGDSVTAANEAAVNLIVEHESGWNPNAINLTDSNAQAGHPSQGLMQTIPSTFLAYAGALASRGITDPIANLVAGIRYADSRYGSPAGTPGARAVSAGRPYVGYAKGGLLPRGKIVGVNTLTGQGITLNEDGQEYVIPANVIRSGDVQRQIAASTGNGSDIGDLLATSNSAATRVAAAQAVVAATTVGQTKLSVIKAEISARDVLISKLRQQSVALAPINDTKQLSAIRDRATRLQDSLATLRAKSAASVILPASNPDAARLRALRAEVHGLRDELGATVDPSARVALQARVRGVNDQIFAITNSAKSGRGGRSSASKANAAEIAKESAEIRKLREEESKLQRASAASRSATAGKRKAISEHIASLRGEVTTLTASEAAAKKYDAAQRTIAENARKNLKSVEAAAASARAALRSGVLREIGDFTASFKNATTAGSDLGSLFAYKPGFGALPVSSVIAQLKYKISQQKDFYGLLHQLALKGVPGDLLKDIIAVGPQAGIAVARELLASPSGLAEIESLEADLTRSTSQLSTLLAGDVFGSAAVGDAAADDSAEDSSSGGDDSAADAPADSSSGAGRDIVTRGPIVRSKPKNKPTTVKPTTSHGAKHTTTHVHSLMTVHGNVVIHDKHDVAGLATTLHRAASGLTRATGKKR